MTWLRLVRNDKILLKTGGLVGETESELINLLRSYLDCMCLYFFLRFISLRGGGGAEGKRESQADAQPKGGSVSRP